MTRNDCPCEQCIKDELRLTEEFAHADKAAARVADLTAKGTLLNSCYCEEGIYFVCFRGVRTTQGVLPRYEGQLLDAP